jgi:DNA-directed RNA polymerase I subunit RPA1
VLGVSFSFYEEDEIRRLSVKRITNPTTYALDLPTNGGLYDRAMGPTQYGELCPTCSLGLDYCPGHLGHIELSQHVYNASLFTLLLTLLKRKCFACHRLRVSAARSRALKVKLMLLSCGRLKEALELDAQLLARPPGAAAAAAAAAEEGEDGEADAAVAAELAHQDRVLGDLEVECINEGGANVGCGLGVAGGAGGADRRFSQQLRCSGLSQAHSV